MRLSILMLILCGALESKAMNRTVICSLEKKELISFVKSGTYRPSSLDQEGFVHCCSPSQLEYVANKYFNKDEYVLLISNDNILGRDLVYENNFPHLYREFKTSDLLDLVFLKRNINGKFNLP